MRKPFLVAGVAALAFAVPGVAQAQVPAPSIEATAKVSPTKAGTKKKPKAEKLKLTVKNDPASKTTASGIKIKFPSTLKLSTKGLKQCKKSDTALLAGPKKVCKKSIAGSGSASAILNPFSSPAPLEFDVTPVVGKNELLFYLEQTNGAVKAVLHGKLKGRTMTIEIPEFLQNPAPMTFSALNELNTTISFKKNKRKGLIVSRGCKGKKHKIGVTVDYVPNPNPPAASSAKTTANAKCR